MVPSTRKFTKKTAEQLKKVNEFVTAADRRAAMAEFKKSYITICRYLQGKAPNANLALELLQFFTKKLKERKDTLSDLTGELNPLTCKNNKDA